MKINKFRGMTKEGVWVYGDLIQTTPRVDGSTKSWIKERSVLGLGVKSTPTESFIEVNSETVGQFTGITDYHGVEVYEGDVISNMEDRKYSVKYQIESFLASFVGFYKKVPYSYSTINCWGEVRLRMEVIGNVHDNPELEVK